MKVGTRWVLERRVVLHRGVEEGDESKLEEYEFLPWRVFFCHA